MLDALEGLTHFQCKLDSSRFCSGSYSAWDEPETHAVRVLKGTRSEDDEWQRRLWQNADRRRAGQTQNRTVDVKRQEQAQNGEILTWKREDREKPEWWTTRRRDVWLQLRARMSGWHSPEVMHIFPHFSGRTNKGNYSALCACSDRWNRNYMKYRNTETVPILTSSQSNQDNRKDTDTLTSTADPSV